MTAESEVEALATVIRTRARSHPQSMDEWLAINRAANEIGKIARRVINRKVSAKVFGHADEEIGSEAADYPEGAVNADGYLRNDRSI